ncbi:MAG TPA: Xaa-Pro peptidase family protein [Dongiaceae bacterium]|jgi:Xaa-Pro aminopeptidase|nr:Xaa-Pro peptidase family protein [Dongiaceae bacterium]
MAMNNGDTGKPIDEVDIRAFRLARLRAQLVGEDLAGIVIVDPVNLRYATGSRNMQVWTMHNPCRYAFVASAGPVVLFDLPSSMHLTRYLETIDERRPSLAWDYMAVGPRGEEMAKRWAAEIADLVRLHGGGNRRLAIDRADLLPAQALLREGVTAVDGKPAMERARAIKSPEEVRAFVRSLQTTEAAIADLHAALRPEMNEQEALAVLIAGSLKRGGEYPETRLLTSGPRTNPWFQETADRVMQAGELLSFDTDLIGPMGFYTDLSRSFLVGDGRPSDAQRRLYDLARRQLAHNIALLRPGISFIELSEKSFRLPERCLPNRYADIAHGCGLGVEYPLIWYAEDAEWGAYDGVLETGMIVCVESYIGEVGGAEGVKLEEPVLITDGAPQILSRYPFEDRFA